MSHLHPQRSDHDQIYQKYLDRAITEINRLTEEISSQADELLHGRTVLPTGHPLADVFLLKARARGSELDQGVAFFGDAGEAIIRSAQRLSINPLDLYGTTACKCDGDECRSGACSSWLRRELTIVEPRMMVLLGTETVEAVNALRIDGACAIVPRIGELQPFTQRCSALVCPDIDAALHADDAKAAFWRAFRTLGSWYDDKPPY